MENWLVISNCQTFGIANCLQSQVKDAHVRGVDTLLFQSDPDGFNAQMDSFQRLFIYEGAKFDLPSAQIDRIAEHVTLPMLTCRAFHPDLVYLTLDGRPLVGPVGDYHSAIAFAAFQKDMSVADTTRYFHNEAFLERCGYMAMWAPERDRLTADFAGIGIDIAAPIRTWGRGDAFMYSINHPKIRALYDIASALLESLGRDPIRNGILPHDNLATGACYAVYPAIGEALGVRGEFAFKDVGNYRPIDLSAFLEGCFASYREAPAGAIEPHPEFKTQIDYISALF